MAMKEKDAVQFQFDQSAGGYYGSKSNGTYLASDPEGEVARISRPWAQALQGRQFGRILPEAQPAARQEQQGKR